MQDEGVAGESDGRTRNMHRSAKIGKTPPPTARVTDLTNQHSPVMQRTTSERFVAVSQCVAHEMRNLLTPAGLRLDVWRLQCHPVMIDAADAERLRATLQEVVGLLDGLEWLRLDRGDVALPGGTPWAHAIEALLTALSGTQASVTIEHTGTGRGALPYIALTQAIVDVALAARDIARGASWQVRLTVDDHDARAEVLLTAVAGTSFALVERAVIGSWTHLGSGAAILHGTPTVRTTPQATTMLLHITAPIEERGREAVSYSESVSVDPVTVLCIDDNVALLDALAVRLALAPGFGHFLRASTLDDALEQLEGQSVSVILLDVQLAAPHDPSVTIAKLRQCCPGARLALFTGGADEALVAWARGNGVDGFVLKGLATSVFLDALVRLSRGEAVWLTHDDV